MGAGEVSPTLEAGLGPITVGAADVDGSELAEDEQDLVEMVGRCIVCIDQQGDIGLVVDASLAHRDSFVCASLACRRAMTTAGRDRLAIAERQMIASGTKRRFQR
jgi:hypothetical protein